MNDDGDSTLARLWAPWRLGYVKGSGDETAAPPEPAQWLEGANRDCFLCRAAGSPGGDASDRTLLVLERSEHAVVVLNLYPYSNCHLLVSPRRHVATLSGLHEAESLAIAQSLAEFTDRLTRRVAAQGINVGLNLGAVAGAGVPGHLHWHVVPRWPGDHNFMATTAGVRVLPQSLDSAWELLRS